jgi:hypothetical protein
MQQLYGLNGSMWPESSGSSDPTSNLVGTGQVGYMII